MSKNGIRGYVVLAIVFVVFSVISFVVPFTKNSVFWNAYIFAIIAIAYQIYVFRISFSGQESVKSKFYGFPIAKIGVVYLVTQLVVSLVEMATAKIFLNWMALILNVVLLAITVVGCIAADVMRDEIVRQDTVLKEEVGNMRALQSLSASLVGLCQEAELKKELQSLADEFKYSDPVSSEDTKEMETELKFLVNEIQRAIVDGDIQSAKSFAVRVKSGLAERNRICKLGK